jgi:hypothetical protein
MAKVTKSVKTLSDKLDKVSESFSVNRYDNGYMIEVGGKQKDDWKTAKILVSTIDELITLIREYDSMELND